MIIDYRFYTYEQYYWKYDDLYILTIVIIIIGMIFNFWILKSVFTNIVHESGVPGTIFPSVIVTQA